MAIAHFAVEFGLGDERGHGVDHDHVDGIGADQGLADFQRLLAVVRLGDEQIVEVDAELAGVCGVERMFGVDEGGHAARLLGLGDDLQGEGGLAGRLRPEDFDHAAARESADAEGAVEGDGPVGMTAMGTMASLFPSRMMEPLPNCFSICERANSIARATLVRHG